MNKGQENVPNHVAIIPDGNRRWARKKGLKPWEGHEEGAKIFEKLINHSLKRGIYCLSIWGSSIDNLTKRPMEEKRALLDIYKRYFQRLLDGNEIYENEVRVNFIGRWEEQFPDSLKDLIYEVVEKTKNYQKKILNFMLAYSGTDEIAEMVQKVHDKYEKGVKITSDMIKENLMTAEIPAVDYLIRTGGEPHNSTGFMMWDIADAQYYFSPLNFPDFNEEKYDEALDEYAKRQRRFGE
ncbi:MAG TPA: polyprenyl diphosphate synthase [Candidatus Moranbacteria bacterium]|nr:polyprenyl diphosphate synthase [Candidatus Moranbacteria bacterium]